jgi:hypothetical protein
MANFKQNSRYRGATVTEVDTDGELKPYTVLKLPIDVPLTSEDYYIRLDQGNQFRPDLISFQVYGTVDFGWAIMEINNITSWLGLTEGVRLRIPPVEAIQEAVELSHERA